MIDFRFTIKEDLEQLPWLYAQTYYGTSEITTNATGMVKEFERLSKNDDYIFVSAVDSNKLVGFCSMVINHDIVEQQKPIIMLWNLRVHPDYRKQKIGKGIISFIEEYGKKKGVEFIFLGCDKKNKGAIKFYKKLGYDQTLGFCKYL